MSAAPEFGAPRPPLPEAVREIEGHDPAMELVHYATWMSMEEGGFMAILRKDGRLFKMEWSSSVFGSSDDRPRWSDLREVDEDQALESIAVWERLSAEAEAALPGF